MVGVFRNILALGVAARKWNNYFSQKIIGYILVRGFLKFINKAWFLTVRQLNIARKECSFLFLA